MKYFIILYFSFLLNGCWGNFDEKCKEGLGGKVNDILETSDGHLVVAGEVYYQGYFWVLKLNKNDNKIWEKTYGGPNDRSYSIIETSDGHLAVAGNKKSVRGDNYNAWVLKIDKKGVNILWEKTYEFTTHIRYTKEVSKSIIVTSDGHLVVSTKGYNLFKINKDNGNIIWKNTDPFLGDPPIVATSDGDLVDVKPRCHNGRYYIIKISGKDGRKLKLY